MTAADSGTRPPAAPTIKPGAKGLAGLAAEGTNTGTFESEDWGLLLLIAAIWGSSFMWMAIGLDHFEPGVIAFGRVFIGAIVLWVAPTPKRRIERKDWGVILAYAICGNAAPGVLFLFAEQRIESAVAGMINSAAPIFVLIIATFMTRKKPAREQTIGLSIGLVGALLLAWPNLTGADAQPLGVMFAGCAVLGYAVANNLLPRLAQTYGGTTVVAWALVASSVILAPYGIWDVTRSGFSWTAVVAVVVLGALGTGLARSLFARLNGRVGATRSSIISYLVPVVAVALGVVVRGDTVGWLEIGGTCLILVGARIASRAGRR